MVTKNPDPGPVCYVLNCFTNIGWNQLPFVTELWGGIVEFLVAG
jgi:hypothetical protein